MKTNARILLLILITAWLSIIGVTHAQTIISGPTISGGTWSPSGNPYIITGNSTLASGQTLTIQPGVIIWISSGISITANGIIQAVGTSSQHITFQAPVSSEFWQAINVNATTGTNVFEYCDFTNANTALAFVNNASDKVMYCTFQNVTNGITMGAYNGVFQVNLVMPVQILNCSFSNCFSQAIYGEAQGQTGVGAGTDPCFIWSSPATLNPMIENCVFNNTGNGCVINIFGEHATSCNGGVASAYGYSYPVILNDIFQNLTGTAFLMRVGSYAGGGSPIFINNTIVNCQTGFSAVDPWDATVEDCVFVGCTNAVHDTGTLSRQIQFNDFYGNTTNFIGYGATYGQGIIPNRNGTIADVLYNISQNPLFVATNDFHLTTSSPCVNAGTPNIAYANMCSPPSISTNYPDLGAYGGPDACNWLDTVPMLPAQLSLTKSNSILWLNFGAIPRSTYQVQYLATNFNAISGTNRWLTNSILTPAARPISIAVSPYPPTNNDAFYRVKSLGRTPGN